MDKVKKFLEYIKEELDTPENLVEMRLNELKRRLDKIFEYEILDDGDVKSPEDLEKVDTSKLSFKDLGIELESSDVSKYSKLYDSLTIKFSDDEYTYTLIIMIDLKEVVNDDNNDDHKVPEDIKNCYIKFKKYSLDRLSEIIGQITKTVKIDDINEDFLIELKIEIDDKFGEEELKIETE